MADTLTTIILGFITRGGARATKAVWTWVMAEDWPRTFGKEVRKVSGVKVPVRRIESWLARPETKDALAMPTESKLATSFESLKDCVTPRLVIRPKRYEPARVEELSLLIFRTALDQFLLSLPLGEELKVIHERETMELGEIKNLVRGGLPADIGTLGLPPNTFESFRRAHEEAPTETNRVLSAFRARPDDPESVIADLTSPIVPWLNPGSAMLLLALAAAASGLNLPLLAKDAYLAAADNGAPDKPRWVAVAAMLLQEDRNNPQFQELLDRLHAEDELSPIPRAIVAYLDDDPASILEVEFGHLDNGDDRALLHRLRSHAHEVAGNTDRVVEELEAGVRASSTPGSVALLLAHWLLHRAVTAGGVAATRDKRRVIELALAVRDQRRAWSGPSWQAVKFAAQAAQSLHEPATALKYTMGPPFGEASTQEAQRPEVIELAAQAALALDHKEALAVVLLTLQGFERKWIEAMLAKEEGDREAAERLLGEAWAAADDPARKWAVQQAMAEAGIWPIPDLDELQRTNPVQAALTLAVSQARRGDNDAAERTIRPHINTSGSAVQLLAELQHNRGEFQAAGQSLLDAHERFNRPEMLVGAALMFEEAHDDDEAVRAAERAIGFLPTGSSKRSDARRILIRRAAARNDFRSVILEAQALIDDGDDHPSTRWLLAQALARRYRLDEAWQVVRKLPRPSPSSEQDVYLWLTLGGHFADDPGFVTDVLEVINEGANEDVRGSALTSIMALGDRVTLSPELNRDVHAEVERFQREFPDNEVIETITFHDVDELFEKLAPHLSTGAETYKDLVEKVAAGVLPIGLLATFARKTYGEALVRRGAGCLPIIRPFADVLASEERGLRSSLNGRIVIEPSALHTMSLIPEWWHLVRSLFKEVSFVSPSRADLVMARHALEMRSTISVGWDPQANSVAVYRIEEEDADRLIDRAVWMDEQSQSLDLVTLNELEHFAELQDDAVLPWMGPVDVAVTSGAVLYSDDPTLRQVAQQAGAAAFGTAAVLNYFAGTGSMLAEQLSQARMTLLENFAVDLMPTLVELEELATREEWSLGAAAFNLTRELFWTGRSDPLQAWVPVVRSVLETNRLAASGWFMAATIGVLKGANGDPSEVAAKLLVATVAALDGDPEAFSLGLDGIRRGLVEARSTGDALRQVILVLLQMESLGRLQERARYAAGLVSSLSDDDREKAMRYILGLD